MLPLLTVLVALLVFYGLLAATGRSLGIMSGLYPTVILIVGISDSIHMLTKYNLELVHHQPFTGAITKVIHEVGMSVFLTSFTTVFRLFDTGNLADASLAKFWCRCLYRNYPRIFDIDPVFASDITNTSF